MSKLTFNDLPSNVQDLVLNSILATNTENGYIDRKVAEDAMSQAITLVQYNNTVEMADDPAAPGADQTAYQVSGEDDFISFLDALFNQAHCGNPDCEACNARQEAREDKQQDDNIESALLGLIGMGITQAAENAVDKAQQTSEKDHWKLFQNLGPVAVYKTETKPGMRFARSATKGIMYTLPESGEEAPLEVLEKMIHCFGKPV